MIVPYTIYFSVYPIPVTRAHLPKVAAQGKGGEIPLIARIIAVCDAFDAMTSDRPYRKRKKAEEAIAEIQKGSGTQFDPLIVSAFLLAFRKGRLLNNNHGAN